MKQLVLATLVILSLNLVVALPAAAAELLVEDFETSFPPAGWTRMHLGAVHEWSWGWSGGHSGEHSAYIRPSYNGAVEDEWLVMPACDTAGAEHLVLSFHESGLNWSSLGGSHVVLVSTTVADDPAAFTPVWSATPADHDAPWLDSEREQWGRVRIDLAAYLGETIHVAFHYLGADADHWWIDDVRLDAPNEHDLAARAILAGSDTWQAGREIDPQVVVANTGANAESFTAFLVAERDGAVVYDEVIAVAELAVGEETVVDFPSFVCESGEYRLTATVPLPADGYPEDNELSIDRVTFTGQRTPLGILFTNWACGPCVEANAALDTWYPLQGDAASLIRVHVWWPAGNDPMYVANPEQSAYLLDMCPTYVNSVPTLYLDNLVEVMEDGSWGWEYRAPAAYAERAITGSPVELAVAFDAGGTTATVTVDVLDPMPDGPYRLMVAVTEDGIHAVGPNGEEHHNQAFRRLFPDQGGTPVSTELGTHTYAVSLDLDPGWVVENLRVTAWVQADTAGSIVNSASIPLAGETTAVDDGDAPPLAGLRLLGARPNPFNPQTTIAFELGAAGPTRLEVFDLAGRRVATLLDDDLPAGRHTVAWNGRDAEGHGVPSGVYLYRLDTGREQARGRMMLVR